MKDYMEQRALDIAQYIIESGATVRTAAQVFKISKSTVHKDVSERLEKINKAIWEQTKSVLDKNKSERHIRGGNATKKKYSH
ncbi:MAG: sporulation transcriptional regulator SpoIIID [Clostridiales bacterium]|nr:sporulation transcriptional regulator SpoIIID [Clostridiales bacterium]